MLWPKITIEKSGYHLAASGAVGRNAYDEQEVALALLERLQAGYPGALAARYKLAAADAAAALAAVPADQLLERIARQRGYIGSGAVLNLQKAAEAVLNDFRSGAIGRVTLETPAEHAAWVAATAVREAERAAKKAAREAASKKKFRRPAEPPAP